MARIEKRENKDGSFSYRVQIRKKGMDIYKTFSTEEAANLYSFYKESLIDNMVSFDVDLGKRVCLSHIVELKLKTIDPSDKRTINAYEKCLENFLFAFGKDPFLCDLTYDDWLETAKKIYEIPVYRGGKNERCKRKMSLETFRRYFAYMSSSISNAHSLGIELENHPLKVIRTFISPKLKD